MTRPAAAGPQSPPRNAVQRAPRWNRPARLSPVAAPRPARRLHAIHVAPAIRSASDAATATGTHAENALPSDRCHHGCRCSSSMDEAILAQRRGGGTYSSSTAAVRRMLVKSATSAWQRSQPAKCASNAARRSGRRGGPTPSRHPRSRRASRRRCSQFIGSVSPAASCGPCAPAISTSPRTRRGSPRSRGARILPHRAGETPPCTRRGSVSIARSRSIRLMADGTIGVARRRFGSVLIVERLGRAAHLRLTPPQMIEAMVHRQAVQPGAERRFAAESGQLPVRLEKHFLQQILRILGRAGHAQHEAEKAPGVLAIQLLERVGVPGPAPRRQLEVGGSHVSWLLRREQGRVAARSCVRNGSCLIGRPKEGTGCQRSAERQPNRKSRESDRRSRVSPRKSSGARRGDADLRATRRGEPGRRSCAQPRRRSRPQDQQGRRAREDAQPPLTLFGVGRHRSRSKLRIRPDPDLDPLRPQQLPLHLHACRRSRRARRRRRSRDDTGAPGSRHVRMMLPTARDARGCPASAAMSPYVATRPGGIRRTAAQHPPCELRHRPTTIFTRSVKPAEIVFVVDARRRRRLVAEARWGPTTTAHRPRAASHFWSGISAPPST